VNLQRLVNLIIPTGEKIGKARDTLPGLSYFGGSGLPSFEGFLLRNDPARFARRRRSIRLRRMVQV
jgi:hypothetical protein